MEKKKILVTDRLTQEAWLTLSNQSFLDVEKTLTPLIENTADISDVHALLIRSRTKIDSAILTRAKKLQVIVTATSGFDHIDLKACEKWGVTVMHTPNANIDSAAQLTWALVLACASKINTAHKMMKAGDWKREFLIGTEMNRKTYGIIGLGRIGSKVCEIAQAFGMNVIAFDPYISENQFRENGAERCAFEEVLKRSDVISFHVPRTSETQNMLNRSQLEYINRGVILVNTSRGGVINEADLAEALENNWIGACGLDVFEKEPLARTSKLQNFPQVILTPHIGANTQEAFAKASEQSALKLLQFFRDGSTSDTLPPKADWYGAVSPWKNSGE